MLGKARELFDLPLIVCVFILFTALEYSEAFTLVEDDYCPTGRPLTREW